MDSEEFLAHYGVIGMKWGVHRTRSRARRDRNDLQRIRVKGGRGSRARYDAKKAEIEAKSAEDPVYAEAAKKKASSKAQVAFVAALGALYVAALVAEHKSNNRRSEFRFDPNFNSENFRENFRSHARPRNVVKTAKDLINEEREQKIYAMKRTHSEGHIDKEQLKTFLDALNKRYDKKIVDAMKDGLKGLAG